jgi:hypothetical protein
MTPLLIIIIALLGLIAVLLMAVLFVLYDTQYTIVLQGNQRRDWHREKTP